VTLELRTAGSLGFSELQVDGDAIFWLEQRAVERGRRALVRWTPAGGASDVLDGAADVGTRVHEYGGGAYTASGGRIVYSDRGDGAVRLIDGSGTHPIVTVPDCRYAAFAIDAPRGRAYAVREDHRGRPYSDPANAIVAIALEPADPAENAGEVLFGLTDFVLAPQLSPDGRRLAFIAWNHPLMPWDASELHVLDLADGAAHRVAGGDGESIVEAAWSPDGALVFSGDRSGWWNLYAWRDGATTPLAPVEAEIGFPPWVFGQRAFVPLGEGRALCVAIRDGDVQSASIEAGTLRALPFGPTASAPLPYRGGAAFIATPAGAPAEIRLAPALRHGEATTLRAASAAHLAPGDVSIGETIRIPTSDGEHTFVTFYPPKNAAVPDAPPGPPPLVVMSHGGPTGMHASGYDLGILWWTTRGFAVAHVNYRGSTGFGRAYRQRLHGAWGVLDVIDCVSAARFLIEAGRADAERVAIRGGSASGMTALLALETSDVFGAATSSYGVMDLIAITVDSHKFELRYTDGLVGPLPAAEAVYRERSPIAHVDRIHAPVLILQGLDDRVVPPDQATAMRDALTARGVPVIFEAFEGEGHGFRKAETIRRAMQLELDFYLDVFAL
jgi:dipeptidyl aminopeptidase/acylaminoacyl peptidase